MLAQPLKYTSGITMKDIKRKYDVAYSKPSFNVKLSPKLKSKWADSTMKKINVDHYHDHRIRKIRELHTFVIRDKWTKEIVDLEELVGNTSQQRNWRGILIALLVILTVLGLIVTAIVLVTPKTEEKIEGEKISFADFTQHHYEPRDFVPIWRDGDEFLYRNDEGAVVQYRCTDQSTNIIMDNSTFRELDTHAYKISKDGKYVLLPYDMRYQYRHSKLARYKLYDTETKIHVDLVGAASSGPHTKEYFQYVTWSPINHSLVFVQGNNLYVWRDPGDPGSNFTQITYDGQMFAIYNGVPDWLYEEEILGSDSALWWSPDGERLLYASFNDTRVHKYGLSIYGPLKEKYIENRRLPYPKPGTPNPTVKLKVYDFSSNSEKTLTPPTSFQNREYYFTNVAWMNNELALVTWLTRVQNMSIMAICHVKSGSCKDSYRAETSNGWLDLDSSAIFTASSDQYFILLPQRDGEKGSFKHIAMIDVTNKYTDGAKMFITSGPLEVKRIVGYDAENMTIYFIAVRQDDPREKHLYSVPTSTDSAEFRTPHCVTCDLDPDCLYVDASFSGSGKYYVLSCLGPGVPYHQLMATPDTLVAVLESNPNLRQKIIGKALPRVEFIKITTPDNHEIWTKLLLPPILKKDERITYNLLVKVYGAPNTQLVTHKFEIGWEHYLSSKHGLIIGFVDGRGSGGRGQEWLLANYKNLGTLEVDDTIYAARHFKSLYYVNDRMAIWGVSHGGFLTSAVLANRKNVFGCGLAVAPVTDWRYYDSFYTEKYMGLPTEDDNLYGYNQANISRFASNFKKTKFMLVHGTGDDNVHFQNSAQLIKALTEVDVYFRTQIYTDQQHWLNGGNTRQHLYNTMEDFLFHCYGRSSPRVEVTEAPHSEKDVGEDE